MTIQTALRRSLRHGVLFACIGLALGTTTAYAQSAPSENATVNLVRLLVKRGVLTQGDADALIAQANTEASQARAASAAVPVVAGAGTAGGQVRVQYVPEVVRNQIRDEVKQEVIAQAKTEHWAEPNALPEWLDRIGWSGDMRVRDEFHYYDKGNAYPVVDFAQLNRTGPYDLNSQNPPPLLNTRENRTNSLRIRARLGVTLTLGDTVTGGIRIGTGNDNNPVSTTQTLGGGLTKKELWLDQAYLTWKPADWVAVTGGRMANPFMSTNLLFADDLNFDGVASQFHVPVSDDVGAFATVGMFPIEYQADDFPTQAGLKSASRDKWLTAAQLGAKWKIDEDTSWKFALAYYRFDHLRGELSSPCSLYLGGNYCDTDSTRSSFMQKGNSLFLLRNIVPDPSSPGNYAQPQFVGLVYDYRLANATTQFDMKVADTPLRLEGDYVRNMAYHRRDAFRDSVGLGRLVNNFDSGAFSADTYKSGPVGWMMRATLGNPQPSGSNDWNVVFGYKYLQPDATVDGLNDPDFHLGGTNAKGFILSGSYGISKYAWISARYFNSKEVFGPPLSIDVFQLEMNARF
ncbi:putative porin [Luteibacter rhizovicinus]|uniref:Putative porin n=1 Tax=Luteibacter rhizovicinus TaxID=242606 RepID=A0A4R3YHT0_9GAMM|nr:putative porin [Luteibacter rhizovicinus]TCV91776.1 putative porin [Luteibacter rhizovicinus]